MERRASEKLTQERRGGNLIGRHRPEVLQKADESVGHHVCGVTVGDVSQKRLGVCLHHSDLKDERRIESSVGIFLKREKSTFPRRGVRWASGGWSRQARCGGILWSRTIRRNSRLSVVDIQLWSSMLRVVSAETYTLKISSGLIPAVSSDLDRGCPRSRARRSCRDAEGAASGCVRQARNCRSAG